MDVVSFDVIVIDPKDESSASGEFTCSARTWDFFFCLTHNINKKKTFAKSMDERVIKDLLSCYNYGIKNYAQYHICQSCWHIVVDYICIHPDLSERFTDVLCKEFSTKGFIHKIELHVNLDDVMTATIYDKNRKHFVHIQAYIFIRAILFEDTRLIEQILWQIISSERYDFNTNEMIPNIFPVSKKHVKNFLRAFIRHFKILLFH